MQIDLWMWQKHHKIHSNLKNLAIFPPSQIQFTKVHTRIPLLRHLQQTIPTRSPKFSFFRIPQLSLQARNPQQCAVLSTHIDYYRFDRILRYCTKKLHQSSPNQRKIRSFERDFQHERFAPRYVPSTELQAFSRPARTCLSCVWCVFLCFILLKTRRKTAGSNF